MYKNFFKPLYQDFSGFGMVIGIVIRFWWIVFFSLYSTIIVLPNLFFCICVLLLPLSPFIIFFIGSAYGVF